MSTRLYPGIGFVDADNAVRFYPGLGVITDTTVTTVTTQSFSGVARHGYALDASSALIGSARHQWIIVAPVALVGRARHRWILDGPIPYQGTARQKWSLAASVLRTASARHQWSLNAATITVGIVRHQWALLSYVTITADARYLYALLGGAIDAPRAGATPVYRLTITDPSSGLADIVLPIANFQARVRSGTNSYLTATVPGVDLIDAIAARADGEFYIEGWLRYADGTETSAQELARANIDRADTFEGATNKSIVLTGYKQTTYSNPKSVIIDKLITKNLQSGVNRWRAPPNFYLRPLDTLDYEGQQITVSEIVYTVGPRQAYMDVSDAVVA